LLPFLFKHYLCSIIGEFTMVNTLLDDNQRAANRSRTNEPTQADHERFMRRAIELSKRAALEECTGGAFGCVIVKDGQIIAEGTNHVVANNDPTCHGEMEAIRQACKKLNSFKLNGCTLYTSSEPCPMCLTATYWARIDKLFYGAGIDDAKRYGDFDDRPFYKEVALPAEKRSLPCKQILRDEAVEVWKQYQAKPDKIHY
jgi:guanine deaminase